MPKKFIIAYAKDPDVSPCEIQTFIAFIKGKKPMGLFFKNSVPYARLLWLKRNSNRTEKLYPLDVHLVVHAGD